MELNKHFSEQTLIEAIQAGDFGFLTQDGIRVETAQTLIDRYYQLPVDEVAQEAIEAGLIKSDGEERFREKIQYAIGGNDEDSSRSLWRRASYGGGFGSRRCDDSPFRDGMMVIREDRLYAELYFVLGSDDGGTILGWAENRDEKRHTSMFRNMFDGKYLTVDNVGRIYLKAAKPVLAARKVSVDARRTYKGDNEVKEIKSAIEKGRQLTFLGLRDPNSRPRDSYVSGRHYSSMDLLVNSGSDDVVSTQMVAGMKQVSKSVLGDGEVEVTTHNLEPLDYDKSTRVVLSVRGNIANDGGIFQQIGSHVTREIADTVKTDPQAAAALTALAVQMALTQ